MKLKRLIVKNFGGIDELDYTPCETINYITKDVADAISYVLNNQFAIRHYNSTELRGDTYLYGVIYFYEKGRKNVYTVEIKGFNDPVFTKNGVRLTDSQVASDPVLTRPYREDNGCIFSARSKDEFLDYDKFLPSYFSRLTEYAQSYRDCLDNKQFYCDIVKRISIRLNKGKVLAFRAFGSSFRQTEELSECDIHCKSYVTFLLLIEMVDYHQQFKRGGVVVRTPIVAQDALSCVDACSIKYLIDKTIEVARQTFFVDKVKI